MKTTILTLLLLAISSVGFAQNNPINFESDGAGADWTWTVFENASNPALEIISNPDQTGNTSATVAKFTALGDGQAYAGVESAHGDTDLGPFVLDETNSTISIMVWKSTISDVGVKLVANSGWAQPEIKVSNTVVNEWEELTFDFSDFPNPPAAEGAYDQIVVFPDFVEGDRTQDNIVYFDNITFSEAGDNGGEPGGNLVTNGDFESGNDGSWTGNGLDIRTEGGNSYNFADVETAGNAYDVNISQNVDLIPGESYLFTFDASTSPGNTRDIVVGIGQSQDPYYADVETVSLTETTQTFSLEMQATDDATGTNFGDTPSRVIFDMGADVGVVVVDNVSLELLSNVSNEVNESPKTFVLNQNYPNPFNPTTNITYDLPASSEVKLEVFNIMGQRVATLVSGVKSAGAHTATFDASNLSSGVYTYRLVSGNSIQVKKMLLIK